MPGFGERLERERLARGIKLENISEATKISTRMLRALETEEFEKLPGGIFNRGFVRSYARYLGLDEDQSVADYLAAAGEVEPPPSADRTLEPGEAVRWVRLVLLAAAVVIFSVTVWHYRRSLHSAWQRMAAHRSQAIPSATANARASSPQPTLPTTSVVAPPQPDRSKDKPAETVPEPISTEKTISIETKAPEAQAAAGDKFTVLVRAREESWLSVIADDHSVMEGILAASEQRQFHAARKLVFVTGNAGGVDITFNGTPVGSIGPNNQRKQVTFTPAGIEQ